MMKKPKIILRKQIKDAAMISAFEELTKIKLPNPPCDIPIEDHILSVQWEMDMTRESARNEYKKILNLFELPFKTENSSRLIFFMKRKCWYDVLFEVYTQENH